MERDILIAFDDSENAMRAVGFVGRFMTRDHSVTLLSVLPDVKTICDMNNPSLTPYFQSQQAAFCGMEDKKKELIREAMNKAKETLVQAGFDSDRIRMKTEVRKEGVARDIVKEARSGYQVVVMGRRGISGFREFFMGSVSQKVLHLAKDMSIVLVD